MNDIVGSGERVRIGILGCDAIKDELELVTAGDPDVVYREYLEFGLHLRPDDLKKAILEKLQHLEGQVDVVFLGYGYCQSLKDIKEQVRVPVVMLEYEDCIAAMLTTERYHSEKKNGGITWFYPAGWAKNGMPGIVRLFDLDCMSAEGYAPEYFLKMMFDGFSRCLFIETGAGDTPSCRCHSEHFANALQLRHESTMGSLDLMRDAWSQVRCVASSMKELRAQGLSVDSPPVSR
jgi:hypothetical protein